MSEKSQLLSFIKKRKKGFPRIPRRVISSPLIKKLAPFPRWIIGIILFLFLVWALSRTLLPQEIRLKLGDISPQEIVAPEDLKVEYRLLTARKKEEAASQVRPVYDELPQVRSNIEKRIDFLLFRLREEKSVNERKRILANSFSLSSSAIDFLANSPDLPRFLFGIKSLFQEIYQKGVIDSWENLEKEISPGITVKKSPGQEINLEVNSFYEINEVRTIARDRIRQLFSDPQAFQVSWEIILSYLESNLKYNALETEMRRLKARESIKNLTGIIKKNQVIIAARHPVTLANLDELVAINSLFDWRDRLPLLGGIVLLVAVLMSLAVIYLERFQPEILQSNSLLLLLSLLVGGPFFLSYITVTSFYHSPETIYFLPITIAPILIAILLNSRLAIVVTFFLALLLGALMKFDLRSPLVFLCGGLTAIYGSSQVQRRGDIVRAGLLISGINLIIISTLNLLDKSPLSYSIRSGLWGMGSGFFAAIFSLGILPYLESTFGITTDIKLLELSDLNHPLLQKMVLEAPGTYHHSIVVGNLAEAAAEAVGANPLLARVSSYYHDIGKINKPEYFVENQKSYKSKHTKLTPRMSCLILVSHIKEGIEMAQKYKLPRAILDVIREHHGTGVMSYFYHQALKEQSSEPVNEDQYRYTGPRPRTKESAIVMLADSVEAASRTLVNPTPGKLQELVRKVINSKFIDGQMDECNLTLWDLHRIEESFLRILAGIFHSRVEYPEKKGEAGGDTDSNSSAQN